MTQFETIEHLEGKDLYPDWAEKAEETCLAVTGIRDGKVIGAGGVHPVDENQGVLWLRLSKECLDFPVETARWLKLGLRIIEETFSFRQLNAVVKCGYENGIRLIEHFGYKQVEIKDDYYVYAKLIGD